MKTKLIIMLALVAGSVLAETNYVYYSQSDGRVLKASTQYAYNLDSDTLKLGDATMSGIDWTVIRLDMTTDALPKDFTKIDQVSHSRVLPLTDEEKADPANWPDQRTAAAVKAIVKLVNDRLPAAQKITDADLTAAIKAESSK